MSHSHYYTAPISPIDISDDDAHVDTPVIPSS